MIPFNIPCFVGRETKHIREAIKKKNFPAMVHLPKNAIHGSRHT